MLLSRQYPIKYIDPRDAQHSAAEHICGKVGTDNHAAYHDTKGPKCCEYNPNEFGMLTDRETSDEQKISTATGVTGGEGFVYITLRIASDLIPRAKLCGRITHRPKSLTPPELFGTL